MTTTLSSDAIYEHLLEGGMLVVPTKQVAHRWQHATYTAQYEKTGARIQDMLHIYSFDRFVRVAWERTALSTHRVVLNRTCENALWRHVLTPMLSILERAALASYVDAAGKAWAYSMRYGITPDHGSTDRARYKKWHAAFADALQQYDAYTDSEMPLLLCETTEIHNLPPILFLGFPDIDDTYTDSHTALLHACGSPIRLAPTPASLPTHNICCPDANAEIDTVLHTIATHRTTPIALVVPENWTEKQQLVQALTDAGRLTQNSLPYRPTAHPATAALETIIRLWHTQTMTTEQLGLLCTHPWCTIAHGDATRKTLMHIPHAVIHIDTLPEQLHNRARSLAALLRKTHAVSRSTAAISEWLTRICNLLTLWGWPNEEAPQAAAQQAHINALCDRISVAERFDITWTIDEFIDFFSAELHTQTTPVSNPHDTVALITLADSISFPQTTMLCVGMTEAQYHTRKKIQPFLCTRAQEAINTAQTNTTKAAHEALITCGHHILAVTHTAVEENGAPLMLPQLPIAPQQRQHDTTSTDEQTRDITTFDTTLPIRGGANFFREYKSCPFRAYAQTVLGLAEHNERGMTARMRGNAIHRILERLYEIPNFRIQIHAERKAAIETIVDSVCTGMDMDAIDPVRAPIERDILHAAVSELTTLDGMRPHADTIAREKTVTYEICERTVDLRIDRIDRLADGTICVIDYKAGNRPKTPIALNTPDTLTEWQLPLYYLACKADTTLQAPSALAYMYCFSDAVVAPHCIVYFDSGRYDDDTARAQFGSDERIVLKPVDFAECAPKWQTQLIDIVTAFYNGNIMPQPKSTHTCTQCAYRPVCRIDDNAAHIPL